MKNISNQSESAATGSDFMKSLNWWKHPSVNSVEDFLFCRNTKLYLSQCANRAGVVFSLKPNPPTVAAMKAAGYNDWQKFVTHAQLWHDLERPVPMGYVSHLGLDLEVLKAVVGFDAENFEKALTLPLRPKVWTLRLMPGVYQVVSFPKELQTEQECIEHIRKLQKSDPLVSRCRAVINTIGLKAIWFEPDGRIWISYRKPTLTFTKTHLFFGSDGRHIGVMSIG
jgi:hypothetical protein